MQNAAFEADNQQDDVIEVMLCPNGCSDRPWCLCIPSQIGLAHSLPSPAHFSLPSLPQCCYQVILNPKSPYICTSQRGLIKAFTNRR